MMKKYLPILIMLLLLTACQSTARQAESPTPVPTPTPMATVTLTPEPTPSPTPEPTSVGIEVDIGDGEHKFWVELTEEGEGKRVNIYEKQGDSRPLQTFEDTEGFVSPSGADLTAEDVNFDGYMDFHFYTSFGYSIVSHSFYYVWDPEEGCFVPDPYGLNELSTAEFRPHTKEISSLSRGPMGTGTVSYCYENGVLVKVGEGFTPEADSHWKAYTARRIKVDEDHVFWVEITQREEQEAGGGIPILVSAYEESSGELKQSFEDEVWLYSLGAATPREVDVNFDGCMDFEYGSWIAASSGGSVYYVWDKEAEQFVRDPYGLENLAMPDFDQERQVIETWNHSGDSYTIEFYRYLDGKLTCVRRLRNQDNYSDDFTATLTVENYDEKTGTLKEVYREENAKIGGVTYASTEEFQRWHDIDYPPARQEIKVDKSQTFWVEAIDTGKPSYNGTVALIRIYCDREDVEPFQTFEETLYMGPLEVMPADVDFDGDMDISVLLHSYRSFRQRAYYIWDESQKKFVEDPYGLQRLNWAEFDSERKIIEEKLWDMMGGMTRYYRYESDELLCVRDFSWEFSSKTEKMNLLVRDGWDGGLETVYECAVSVDDWSNGTGSVEEFKRWYDLDYPGE